MRILVIRGGAVGDFVLTLPAVELLRKRWPSAHIECLGYPGIARLGLKRRYFDALRAMDYGPLAGFFVPDLILEPDLMDYFGSFQLVLSYVYDPDHIFRKNLQRCGLQEIESLSKDDLSGWEGVPALLLYGDPRVRNVEAVRHFIEPLRVLELEEAVPQSRLYLSDEDRRFAREKIGKGGGGEKIVVMHPGSGSSSKNWPIENWIDLVARIRVIKELRLLVTGGEADTEVLARMKRSVAGDLWMEDSLNLNELAALYAEADLFLGHDSGPGHIAAAVGTSSVLLFGSTDPVLWAPRADHVTVLEAAGDWNSLTPDSVWEIVRQRLTEN